MLINQPLEIKDPEKVIKELSKLDYLEIEQVYNNQFKESYSEYIIKKRIISFGILHFIQKTILDIGWLGQILRDSSNKKYYFLNENGTLNDIFKLNKNKIRMVEENGTIQNSLCRKS